MPQKVAQKILYAPSDCEVKAQTYEEKLCHKM